MARRPYARSLAAFRLAMLATLVVGAAVLVRDMARFELPLAGLVHDLGPDATSIVWWDTRAATTAAVLASLLVFPVVSLLTVPGRRRP